MAAHRMSSFRYIFALFFLTTCAQTALLRCEAFQSKVSCSNKVSKIRQPTSCYVLSEPPADLNAWNSQDRRRRHPRNNNNKRGANRVIRRKVRYGKKEDVWSSGRWDRAILVESKLRDALDALQESIKLHEKGFTMEKYPLPFPAIRECNAALASFGDGGDILRALRLYFKMRKAASLRERSSTRIWQPVPTPTLVTFSTMMSRAVYVGKPLIAIRLWNIMQLQADSFSSTSSVPRSMRIVPDVKAANILMNAYAKLGDIEMAQDLFDQMIGGGGHDVPKMTPNLVTYNTLLDACHKSGELDIAIHVKEQLDYTELSPDTRTYTTLIASVARKATAASGANDPTLAFLFLQEMKSLNIKPNGMTYSALIDVCGRCQRSDLALKGLRLMLDQKAQEQKRLEISTQRGYTLSNEVGAWTAAIDACGKAGRIDTALKLFYTMPNFGVNPNTITCGSLVDCLLRNGRTADSLKVLRYMKKHHIAPSEVMYTSLMTSASRLAEFENQKLNESSPPKKIEENKVPLLPVGLSDDHGATKAVEVYTELMASLSQVPRAGLSKSSGDSNELFRVALVFQEMKAAGVEPDLACYNALLKSCANIGDADRAREVLNQICASDEVEPNEQTWNAVIRAAGKAGRSDVALATWQSAVDDALKGREDSRPLRSKSLSDRSFASLLSALVRSAEDKNIDRHTKVRLYQLVVKIYAAVNSQSQFLGMDMVNKEKIVQNMLIMGTILQAVVSLEKFVKSEGETITMGASQLRRLAVSIVQLDCFKDGLTFLQRNAAISAAHKIASSWSY